MSISITASELEQLLDATPATHNVMLMGKHGIGKSEILSRYYARKGMKVIALFLGQMSDPGDLIGLPRLNEETGKTDFMPPYWFPTDGSPIVLFLDELNRARPEVLQTIMDLALNRCIAGREMPAGSRIISAVNVGEEYQLTDLDPALVSRFNIYNFRPSVQEWLAWAEKNKVDKRITTFIHENPAMLDGDDSNEDNDLRKSPDRRGWKRVSDIITGVKQLSDIHKKLIAGIVGVRAAAKFRLAVDDPTRLSGKDVLQNFSKHSKQIAKMPLHELTRLNESLFCYMEANIEEVQENKEVYAKSIQAYIKLLLKSKMEEAFRHMSHDFMSDTYKNTRKFFMYNVPKVFDCIQEAINKIS